MEESLKEPDKRPKTPIFWAKNVHAASGFVRRTLCSAAAGSPGLNWRNGRPDRLWAKLLSPVERSSR